MACLLVLFLVPTAQATWHENGNIYQTYPADNAGIYNIGVPDGAGGLITAWFDSHNGDDDVFAQRVDADGAVLWQAGGVPVCVMSGFQTEVHMTSDGVGGAIIAWHDARMMPLVVYAQRIDADGNALWTTNGVPVFFAAPSSADFQIISSGGGSSIIAWRDLRNGNGDIYIQKLNSAGSRMWGNDGIALCTDAGYQRDVVLTSDTEGGAIAAWVDLRNATTAIYSRRINFLGAPQWTTDGVAVAPTAADQTEPDIITDGVGGAIIAWTDARFGDQDIYAQRLDASGTLQWSASGRIVCSAIEGQGGVAMASDGSGGALAVWSDFRNSVDTDIYAQRLAPNGYPMWPNNGAPVCTEAGGQSEPTIVPDGEGGAITAWNDGRGQDADIYAAHLEASGSMPWAINGVPVCTAGGNQTSANIVSRADGSVIINWGDELPGGKRHYAQRIEPRYGQWGTPEPRIASVSDAPSDEGGSVVLNWRASGLDVINYQTIDYYSLWRATDAAAAPSGGNAKMLTSPSQLTRDMAGPIYLSGEGYYWELVTTQDAVYLSNYSKLVATREDSTSAGTRQHYFRVIAHADSPYTFWPSEVDSGYSVDNLAPTAPLSLSATRVGNYVRLDWSPGGGNEPDFAQYAVYRASSAGVQPDPAYYLSASSDTTMWDQNASPDTPWHYVVTAIDVHQNESDPSNEASVGSTVVGVGAPPVPRALTLRPNAPNPFSSTTDIHIGLPGMASVSIDVFDVAGHRVASRVSNVSGGWQTILFDGRDDRGEMLPSGVYFYRVTASRETVTRKLVISR